MNRRTLLQAGWCAMAGNAIGMGMSNPPYQKASAVLQKATESGLVSCAVMHVVHRGVEHTELFGKSQSRDDMFLLGSISKPIAMTALMTLYDEGQFQLDDPLKKFLTDFQGADREAITLRHLLSHTSGLPDQLENNDQLRRAHAPLSDFVRHAKRAPVHFSPGTKYEYSSMGILLCAHVAELISGNSIIELVQRRVLDPLGMKHSAQGLAGFRKDQMIPVQTEFAAPEAGGGDPTAKNWDWNSDYWRQLGAPWGGTHASAPDIARFLMEFYVPQGKAIQPTTATLMTTNQNRPGLVQRGLGFAVGTSAASPGCSGKSFGHTGSTGTIAWADPESETLCVILTSLPARAVTPHPRDLAAADVARAVAR